VVGRAAALRRWRRRLWMAAACVGVLWLGLVTFQRARGAHDATAVAGADAGTALGGTPAPGFRLVDQFGQAVSLARFRGHAVLLAFVDSRCTTICPLTAATLREAEILLGPEAARVQAVAVNVNAAANSVSDVRQWSRQHGMLHHWLFLTGSPQALAAVWRAYGVYVQVVDGALMHDAAVFVIGPHGRERDLFTTQPNPLSGDIVAQGRLLASAAAATLGLRPPLRQAVAVPRPAFVPYGPARGTGSFALPALAAPAPPGRPVRVAVGEGRPALVDFFSPSCEACVQELPVLAAYARASRHDGLPPPVLVELAFGGFSGLTGLPPALRQHPPFPIVADVTGSLTDSYGVTALPYQALTTAEGRIVWRHAGVLGLAALLHAVGGGRRG
jgi:cytochrome oxidase Cu insertion factor (SCO1/SenC/PrrC family)